MLAAMTEMLPTTQIMNKSYNNIESASQKLYQMIPFSQVNGMRYFPIIFQSLRAISEQEVQFITRELNMK
jgi:hypothetical protein